MKKGWVDAIVVGCDRMAANGDGANKIGTSGVAILAKEYGIPFYMYVPTSTIDLSTKTGEDIVVDLHIPGRFAAEVTDGALQSVGKDYFVWGCEDVTLTALKARCITADSGTAQPVLQLFVDGVPVGDMFSPAVDHWVYIALPRVKMQYGHSVEIAVVNTGDIKDASDMHVIIMSEYVPPEIQAPNAPGGGGTSQSDDIFTETISGPYFPVESLDLLVGQTVDTAVRFPPGMTDKSRTYSDRKSVV